MSILSNKPIMSSTPLSNRLVVELNNFKFFVKKHFFAAAVPAAPASRVAPDSPNDENVDRDAVARIVKGVGEGWCCHLANNSIALFIPSKLFDITLSREHFVNLLEYCEEHLKVKRVLACFDKSEIDPREGIPRALKCIGFSVLPPNRFPNWLDPKTTFAMVYTI